MIRCIATFGLLLQCVVLLAPSLSADDKKSDKKDKKKKAAAAAKEQPGATSEKTETTATAADDKKEAPKVESGDKKPAGETPTQAPAQAPATGTAAPTATAPAAPAGTTKVSRGAVKVDVTLSGALEGTSMTEVALVPKQWGQMVVMEAVPAGTRVSKGQVLLKLDTEKLDEAIRDSETNQTLAQLNLQQARETYALLEKAAPLDTELSERNHKMAQEDYDLYVKKDAPLAKKSADFQLKRSEQALEYAQEEFKQLEKMYKADDLTEETEEIILKRARNDVELSEFFTELARIRHDRTLNVDQVRIAERQKQGLQLSELAYERSRFSLPALMKKQKIDLDKMEVEQKKSDERFAELKQDRESFIIKSPADGLAQYGRNHNGRWITAAGVAPRMRRGGQVMAYETIFTIVSDGSWVVKATIPERDVASVKPGTVGRMKAAAFSKESIPVKVREISAVPGGDGSFETVLELLSKPTSQLVAGMSCEIKLTVHSNANAVLVPTKAVFSDELDDEKQFVYLAGADGKPQKREVVTGHAKGEQTEIVSGLSGDESIFLQKPAE